jgi:hypothetical protein
LPSRARKEADAVSATKVADRFTSVATGLRRPNPLFWRRTLRPGYESIMNDTQLYFAIGVPVFAVMMSFLGNMFQMNALNARFTGMEARFTSLEGRMNNLEATFNSRFAILEARLDTLIGKVIEIDNRLTRVEERLDLR